MRRPSLILILVAPTLALGQSLTEEIASSMKWRLVGPSRGGRSVAVSGVPGRPNEFYMGTCGGGLWKSTNAGVDWAPVTDGFLKWGSIGAVAVSASNPDTVYVGTGECDIRGNISPGDGAYKSTDGGKTWTHIGLRETRFIGKIRIHPSNPDVAYVAALGHVYGPNKERGVFKTTDGGKSWIKVLYESDKAGAIDVELDPSDPETLYAATWEAWRTPYSLNSGGPGSKLWKSTDAGESWTDLSNNPGMPKGPLGKIGVCPSPADPKRLYAIIEANDGGVFSSDDAGQSWKQTNDDRNWRQRAWYYSHVAADPKERDTVIVLNVSNGRSKDGGKTFANWFAGHSDNHDIWIDPADPQRMIVGNDGGGTVTVDGGKTWTEQDYPTAQFYHVSTDNWFPYRILGAQQDNSTVRITSRPTGDPSDWTSTAGGESGYVAAKPDNPDIVFGGSYGGDLSMFDHRTQRSRSVDPWPDNPMGHGAEDLVHRFQWTFPIVFSPHDPNKLYTCSQFVLMSTDMGASWKTISPDLTRNDKSTMGPSGGPITKDNTSVEYYGTVFTFAESQVRKGLLWAGSDDGLVHMSANGGKTWSDVTPKGMPKWGLCSMVEPSKIDANVAFLAVDNHENDDHTPYVFMTSDLGKSWRRIDGGLPRDEFVRVVRQDPNVANTLYAGTETGVHLSVDGGQSWEPLQNGLPNVPIHDLVWKDGDLVVATHGRSFFVLEKTEALAQSAQAKSSHILFSPAPASRASAGRGATGGAALDYYLASDVASIKFEIIDSNGERVAVDEGQSKTKGFHRFSRGLSYPSFTVPQGIILWAGRGRSIPAPPGEYTVRMTTDRGTITQKLRWNKDPRTPATDADLQEQCRFAREISLRIDEAHAALAKARKLREGTDDEALAAELTDIENAIYQTKLKSGQDPLNYPIRLNDKLVGLFGNVLSGDYRPTEQCYAVFKVLNRQLQAELDKLKALEAKMAKH